MVNYQTNVIYQSKNCVKFAYLGIFYNFRLLNKKKKLNFEIFRTFKNKSAVKSFTYRVCLFNLDR